MNTALNMTCFPVGFSCSVRSPLEPLEYSFSCLSIISPSLLASVLTRFRASYPDMEVVLFEGAMHEVGEWIESSIIDVGFVVLPAPGIVRYQASDSATILALVREGLGITLVPRMMLPKKLEGVVALPLDPLVLPRESQGSQRFS